MLRLLVHRGLLTLLLAAGCAPAPAAEPLVTQCGVDMIVRWEVGGPDYYARCCRRPSWPGNSASGVTVGIGYDLGHQAASTILEDWAGHPRRQTLAAMAGFKGRTAQALAREHRDVVVELPFAMRVFRDPTLVRYYNIARRSFPGMQHLPPTTQDALVSLVYNRGGNMLGTRRREMRRIRDVCIPNRDAECVAEQLRAMIWIWEGSVIEKGMTNRRYDEARLAEGERCASG